MSSPPTGVSPITSQLVGGVGPVTSAEINQLVLDLTVPEKREAALIDLSKKRESVPDLALILWHSFGTMSALLQEIVAIYPLLSPPKLKGAASNRVCNALALLQCCASHPETRTPLMLAHIPLYLYPFLNTSSKSRPFEYLRLTSLGVIGALVKVDDPEVVAFLLNTEIVPLCLRIMETGSDLSRTVATFIIQKILLDDDGLNNYICSTYERFVAVANVLSIMVCPPPQPPQQQSQQAATTGPEPVTARLLKHVVRCYLRLTENPRAREHLQKMLPQNFLDGTVVNLLKDDKDPSTRKWLGMLFINLNLAPPPLVVAAAAQAAGITP